MTATPTALDHAGRAWDAAYRLDELRGDTAASEWTARKVRELIRTRRADEPGEVARLADALERRLNAQGAASDEDEGAA